MFTLLGALTAMALTTALHSAACTVGDNKAAATCGTYVVFEDRAEHAGRTLELHFVIVKAKNASRGVIAFNPGGPGASSVDDAPLFAQDDGPFTALHDHYDILLLDNRGTGASAPLNCDFAPRAHKDAYFLQLWPDSIVSSCRQTLAAKANLSLYTTSLSVDDLDDLRGALGITKLSLFGGSYGTTFYLDYARRHPEHIASIVLDGVAPPHYYILPLPMAQGAQASLNALFSACAKDAVCGHRFAHLNDHFAALLRRFDRGPVPVTLVRDVNGSATTLLLSKEVFAEGIRHALYFPADAASLPAVIERAYRGDTRALAALVDKMSQGFAQTQAAGLNLSVSCAEDIPFIADTDVQRMGANTFEGDVRVRAQQRACALWNVQPVPSSFIEPVNSEVPMLMVSGSDDPATPPQYARAALASLPNARIMLVPGASHDSDFPPCVYATMVAFFDAGSAANLQLDRCAATYKRHVFDTLTAFEPAPGGDSRVSARVRSLLAALTQGRIDRSQLAPSFSKKFPPALVKQLGEELGGAGSLESVVFRSATRSHGATVYGYLAHFELGDATVSLTLAPDAKIASFEVTPQ